MNKKLILIVGAILVMALFIFKSFFSSVAEHGTTESISASIKELKSNNALSKIGLKNNDEELSNLAKIQEALVNDKKNDQIEITYSEIEEKEQRINQIYQMDQKKMHLYLDEIKENQKVIIKWKREHGVAVSALENTDPEFALALSAITNKPVEEAVEINRDELGFSAHEWYYIKAFAASGDIQKLMSQGNLTEEYINIENLSIAYSNNPQMVYKKDGSIDGIPKSEENLEEAANAESDPID